VAGALRGRGFLLGELGPTVAVEVQFGYEPAGVAGRASAAADVTATVRSPDGREREVLASSVGDVALPEAPTDLLSASARAGRFACEGAALRLAEALEELFAR
jgi:hypothetical protein